jgi:hypothetical protein
MSQIRLCDLSLLHSELRTNVAFRRPSTSLRKIAQEPLVTRQADINFPNTLARPVITDSHGKYI